MCRRPQFHIRSTLRVFHQRHPPAPSRQNGKHAAASIGCGVLISAASCVGAAAVRESQPKSSYFSWPQSRAWGGGEGVAGDAWERLAPTLHGMDPLAPPSLCSPLHLATLHPSLTPSPLRPHLPLSSGCRCWSATWGSQQMGEPRCPWPDHWLECNGVCGVVARTPSDGAPLFALPTQRPPLGSLLCRLFAQDDPPPWLQHGRAALVWCATPARMTYPPSPSHTFPYPPSPSLTFPYPAAPPLTFPYPASACLSLPQPASACLSLPHPPSLKGTLP